jgi:hypothetical protein
MTKATISPNEIAVVFTSRPEIGRDYLAVDVPNGWDDCKKLTKKVLKYEGRSFVWTGWNSDVLKCYFSAPCGGSATVATI